MDTIEWRPLPLDRKMVNRASLLGYVLVMPQHPLDYESPQPRTLLNRRLVRVVAASAILGMVWDVIAICLMGGHPRDAFRASWLIAGITAGVAAGLFTVWSRSKRRGRESFMMGVGNYYFAIFVYWLVFLLTERFQMCIRAGSWTDFDLHDHVRFLIVFLIFGTFPNGLFLLPVCFASRQIVWRIYSGRVAT